MMHTDVAATHSIANCQIAVVIPAFKASSSIVSVLDGIPDFVSLIVVVDDASPDDVASKVRNKADKDSRLRLVQHPVNMGVGGAVLTGYRTAFEAGMKIFVKMDSDGQMDPRYLPILIRPLLTGQADYAKGNRFLHQVELTRMPLARRIGNLGLSFFTKLASGYWNIFDPTNG